MDEREKAMKKIAGIPDGWELDRIGTPVEGEFFVDALGRVSEVPKGLFLSKNYIIICKIEKPKTYRPFKDAAEFHPHRYKWWKRKGDVQCSKYPTTYPPAAYNDISHGGQPWGEAFEQRIFEDGSPFGVDVTE